MGGKQAMARIHMPGIDPGFAALGDAPDLTPDFTNKPALKALIATDHPLHNLLLHRFLSAYRDNRRADKSVVLKSFPVVVEDFSYYERLPKAGKKVMMAGASALRVRTRLTRKLNEKKAIGQIVKATDQARAKGRVHIPGTGAGQARKLRDLPFLIETRNFYNFYHFTTESLIYLQMYLDHGLTGEIHFLTGGKTEVKGYLVQAVRDFYPEIADRVTWHNGGAEFPHAIVPFNSNHLYHACTPDILPDIEEPAGFAGVASGDLRPASTDNYKAVYRHSRDEYIDRHRTAALQHAACENPLTRIYVARKPGDTVKERTIEGEEKLVEMLQRHGFQTVHFEDMPPREQAGLCNGAEIMVSAHGAGFANMLYASPGSHFIELSHLQTARHRFDDFNMHAAASGTNYIRFFVDHSDSGGEVDAQDVPQMSSENHVGLCLSEAAILRLEGYIDTLAHPGRYRSFTRRLKASVDRNEDQKAMQMIRRNDLYARTCVNTCIIGGEINERWQDQQGAMDFYRRAASLAPYRQDVWARIIRLAEAQGLDKELGEATEASRKYRPFRWMRWARDPGGGIRFLKG